jgi:hypothetical protein
MISIRITAGAGVGQVQRFDSTILPAWAQTRVRNGTAEVIEEKARSETAMLEPRASAAVTTAHNPPPRGARGPGGRFQPRR